MNDRERRRLRWPTWRGWLSSLLMLVGLGLGPLAAQASEDPTVEARSLAFMSPLVGEMVESVTALEAFIDADLPFLRAQRRARVAELEARLEEPLIEPALYERLLATWRSELDYGRELDSWRGPLVGDDRREVDYLRVGRIGLYYLTPDGRRGAVWKVDEEGWQPLEGEALAELRKALQVVEERRAPELLTLPLSVTSVATPPPASEAPVVGEPAASGSERLLGAASRDAIQTVAADRVGQLRDELADSWLLVGGEAELPARLNDTGEGEAAALLAELRRLAMESARVRRFSAEVADAAGRIEAREVWRLGAMLAVADGGLLTRGGKAIEGAEDGPLRVVEGLPASARERIRAFAAGEGDRLPLDPSDGQALRALAQQPSLVERFHQGGIVGYVVVALGGVGLLVALAQYVYLLRVTTAMRRQRRDLDRLRDDNPLGRVLQRFQRLDGDHSPEALEARLDEALLAEQPRLERGQPLVKLLAAVAPLLGLLGTVTGMIVTFQSITVYGTGDPQLMAGGISQALVTTVLGLITAVPLLFAHTALASRGRRLTGVLEGRASAVLAERLEAMPRSTASHAHAPVLA